MKTFLFPRWCRLLGFVLLLIAAWSYNQEFSFFATAKPVLPASTAPLNEDHPLTEGEDFVFLEYTDHPTATAENLDLDGSFGNHNLTDEFATTGILLGLFLIGFSRLKQEDEYTIQLRLRALNLTVYLSYLLVIGITFARYGLSYMLTITTWIGVIPALYILVLSYFLYIHPRLFATARS